MNSRTLLSYRLVVAFILFFMLGGNVPVSQASSLNSPVLVVVNDNQTYKFGRYLGEILQVEGLNAYDLIDISAMTAGGLSAYPLVILAQTSLTSAQASLLTGYVSGGGRLIAMRPDAQIKSLFGLSTAQGTQTDGYLGLSSTAAINGVIPAQGLVTATMQIHGSTDRYTPAANSLLLAQLYSSASTATPYPAVASAVYGSGRGIAFLYDLPTSTIYMRQGNPTNGSYVNPVTHVTGDVDGDGVFRTIDLFQTIGGGAPWVDLNKVPIPQADIQTRYFARLVKQMVGEVQPLPSLWYFPGNAMTMLIMTADAHANPTASFTTEINSLAAHHGDMTFYLAIGSNPTPTDVKNWMAVYGYTFGIHPYANRPDTYPPYNITNLQQGYQVLNNWYQTYYAPAPYNIPMSPTVRNHQVAWAGWTDSADYAAATGIGMDTSFYHWGPWLQKADSSWAHGYITGSGQPMKFIRADGAILPVYQQLTELVDEQLLVSTDALYESLSGAQGVVVSQQVIDASLGGYYEALMTQNHVDYYTNGDPKVWAEGTMDYAFSKGVPMWNADKWYNFTQVRHNATYTNLGWDAINSILTFTLNASSGTVGNLTTVLPAIYAGKNLQSVQVDGVTKATQTVSVNGVNQIFVSIPAGNHAFTVNYSTVVVTSTPTAAASATATATNTQVPATATATPAAGTSTNTPTAAAATATPIPATPTTIPTTTGSGGSLTHSSYADFAQACVNLTNTHVSDLGGGAVGLAASFADDFSAASLNTSRWASGLWSGGAYSPSLSGGVISLQATGGAWVRSSSGYTHGTLEVSAQFGNAAFQHIGFGSDGFSGNRYFLFSTYNGDGNLYARVNNNVSEQQVNLGAVPVGMHRYQIDWSALNSSTDQVAFSIDGSQVALLSVTNVGASNFYLYLSNASGTVALQVDAAQVSPSYVSSGSYTSCALDAGTGSRWQSISWDASAAAGTGASVQVQTSADGVTWSGWSGASNAAGSAVALPQRYLRYQLNLSSSNNQLSPWINAVTLAFGP